MTTKRETAPDNWHTSVNLPLAFLWALALPAILCTFAGFHWLATSLMTIAWALLNARVIDRYLPVVTAPPIEFVFRLTRGGRESQPRSKS